MKISPLIYIYLLLFFFTTNIYSQCLNTVSNASNTGGYFDGDISNAETYWTMSSSTGYGSFSIETQDHYFGSGSLKVIVDQSNAENYNIYSSDSCDFDISSGSEYNVSLYIRGDVDDVIEVALMDNNTEIGTVSHTIQFNGWHYIRKNITATQTSSNIGRLKITFQNDGAYWLDNIVLESGEAKEWYVNNGSSGSGTEASPFGTLTAAINNNNQYNNGDIVYVKDDGGDYGDNNSGDTDNGAYFQLQSSFLNSTNGSVNRPIVIRSYPGDSPKILFDGSGAIVLGQGHSSNNPDNYNRITHVEIGGLTIQGPNQNITYNEAKTNRDDAVTNGLSHDTQNLFHGRGIAVWAGEYVNIHNNTVYDTPNSGIRVNNTDYARIIGNTVFNTTWWSYNAESGIVMAQSYNWDDDLTDPPTKIKMRIENNLSYDNVNRLPYF